MLTRAVTFGTLIWQSLLINTNKANTNTT